MWTRRSFIIAALLALAVPLLAQEPAAAPEEPRGGWRTFDESGLAQLSPAKGNLTLPVGTWVTVRVNQELSSDHNYPGDVFTATLSQPLIAEGVVVARRGQTVGGQVVEAVKAGRSRGTSRLAVELSELTLVNGRQVPMRTRLIQYQGDTSKANDAGVIATTAGVGATIGGIADGGFGAGMGAIAGAAAGIIGVIATRGKPTVLYPETQLTFRLEDPLIISTETAAQVFRPATQEDYEQASLRREKQTPPEPRNYYAPRVWWYGPYYPPYFGAYYPPYFYGPSFYFYSGPRYYGRWGHGPHW
jgi:hypothetical protein